MSQQSVRQAARRSALEAQAERRKQRADRERRIEALAVVVLTALAERDGAVATRKGREALQTMTDDEGLSLRGGGRVGHVSLETTSRRTRRSCQRRANRGGRMDRTVPIFFNGYAGLDISRDNGEVVELRPEDRAPFALTGTMKRVVYDIRPWPPRNVALHQAPTAGTRRATSSHDSLQRSRSCMSTSLLSTRGG